MRVYRGEVYLVDFGIGYGSEQGGVRPAVIVQNNIGNKYSPTTIVVPVTSRQTKAHIPTHVRVKGACLTKKSLALTYIQERKSQMIGFIVGLFVGAFLGVVVMCCCFVASKADDEMEKMKTDTFGEKDDH